MFPHREGDAAFDRLWKSLEENSLGPFDTRVWPPLDDQGRPTDPCPYPGLMAFSERLAPVYFGRDREAADVIELLTRMRNVGEPRMLLIHGGAGSGKSSLLRAGVLPRFDRNHAWQVLPTLRYSALALSTTGQDRVLEALQSDELKRSLALARSRELRSWDPDATGIPASNAVVLREKIAADFAAVRNRGLSNSMKNGLTDEENLRLFVSTEPAEIADLILAGFSRLFPIEGRLRCFAFFGQCECLFWTASGERSDVESEVREVGGRRARASAPIHQRVQGRGCADAA